MAIQTINDLLNDLKSLATKYGVDTKIGFQTKNCMGDLQIVPIIFTPVVGESYRHQFDGNDKLEPCSQVHITDTGSVPSDAFPAVVKSFNNARPKRLQNSFNTEIVIKIQAYE